MSMIDEYKNIRSISGEGEDDLYKKVMLISLSGRQMYIIRFHSAVTEHSKYTAIIYCGYSPEHKGRMEIKYDDVNEDQIDNCFNATKYTNTIQESLDFLKSIGVFNEAFGFRISFDF